MIIEPEKRDELLEAAKPLIKWLNDNCHPHCQAIVDCTTAEVLEGVTIVRTDEFLKD